MRDPFGISGGMTQPRSAIKQMARPIVQKTASPPPPTGIQRLEHQGRGAYARSGMGPEVRYRAGNNVSVSRVLPNANPDLVRGLRLIADPNMKVGAETRGWGNNTAVYYNPNQPMNALPGVLAHELVHVAQRRGLGNLGPTAQAIGAGVDLLRGTEQGTTFRDFTEPAAYYLAGNGPTRTQLSQVSPWLRPFYSQILR